MYSRFSKVLFFEPLRCVCVSRSVACSTNASNFDPSAPPGFQSASRSCAVPSSAGLISVLRSLFPRVAAPDWSPACLPLRFSLDVSQSSNTRELLAGRLWAYTPASQHYAPLTFRRLSFFFYEILIFFLAFPPSAAVARRRPTIGSVCSTTMAGSILSFRVPKRATRERRRMRRRGKRANKSTRYVQLCQEWNKWKVNITSTCYLSSFFIFFSVFASSSCENRRLEDEFLERFPLALPLYTLHFVSSFLFSYFSSYLFSRPPEPL